MITVIIIIDFRLLDKHVQVLLIVCQYKGVFDLDSDPVFIVVCLHVVGRIAVRGSEKITGAV